MNPAQITYISTSSDGEFSLRTWALLGDVRDPNRLDLLWTMNATPLLQSQKERGVRIRKRIRKLSRKERMAVFSRVKEDKDHKDNMRAIVNDHLRLLSQGVNQDLAQDARAKRRLQDAEQRGPKKLRRCMDKALQGSSRTSATSKSASTSATASTSSSRLSAIEASSLMNLAQIEYLNTTKHGEFSLRSWASLGDVRDPSQLDILWTKSATTLLQSQKERGANILKRVQQMSQAERMAVFSRVKEDKDHADNMRSIVNDHLRLLSQGVNQDLAQDAHAKRRLQDAEQRGPKKLRRCMDKALQGSSRTSATSKSASTSASASTSSSRLATTPSVAPSYSSTPVKPLASASSVAASTSTTTIGHSDLMLDTKTARTITTTIMGHKLSGPFQQLQVQAASVVNNLKEKATLDKLHLFMAANHIWMSSTPLPGLPQQAHDSIARSFRGDEHLLSEHMQALCKEFSSELAETGRVRARAMDTEEEEDLMLLYQNMSKKLPREFFAWVQNNKDTFAHGAIDIILRHIFPENTPPYELDWVNRPASGSKARRGDPLKPDATVIKSAVEVAYVEIMAPKDSSSQTKFVEDQWNLASEARDLIDLHLRNQRQVTVVPCLQVFGYKVKLFKMEYVGGLYIWTEVAAGYLPRDHHDLDVVPRLLSLFARLKTILNGINVQIPPQQLPDELLPEDARPQPVNISPTMRPFFPKLRRP